MRITVNADAAEVVAGQPVSLSLDVESGVEPITALWFLPDGTRVQDAGAVYAPSFSEGPSETLYVVAEDANGARDWRSFTIAALVAPVVTSSISNLAVVVDTNPLLMPNRPGVYRTYLRWTDAMDSEDTVQVEQSSDGGQTFRLISQAPVADLGVTGTETGLYLKLYIGDWPVDGSLQYRICGSALGGAGVSPYSNIAATPPNVLLPGVASAPGVVSVNSVSSGEVSLSWEPPDYDGGSPVRAYVVFGSDGSVFQTEDGTVLSGTYEVASGHLAFVVVALTEAGAGLPSIPAWVEVP